MEPFPTIELVGLLICVFMSAYFSGTETALTSLSEIKASIMGEKYSFVSPVLKKWSDNPSLILSSLLIGNNIVNVVATLLGGKIAYSLLASYQTPIPDIAATLVMTVALLIFGEITPKTFGKLNPEKWLLPALIAFRFFDWILRPLSLLFSKIARFIVKIAGGEGRGSDVTQTDIEYLIQKGNNQGVFEQEEQGELLTSVIEFKDTLVKEIMTPRTDTNLLETESAIAEAVEKIEEWGHSRIPVFEDSVDNIKGILYVKDLALLVTKDKSVLNEKISTIMRKSVFYVPETQKINETLKKMQADGTHIGIVVDEFGGTAGIITLEDILEEIVGEIRDEDDKDEKQFERICDGALLVDAHISISDLEEELDISIPDDGEYNSLGGFIVNEAGSVPPEGYLLSYKNYQFKVVESNEKQIVKVEIRIFAEEENADSPL